MKIVITIIVLLIAGAGAYFMFVDPDALDKMRGIEAPPAQSAPATPGPKAKPKAAKPKAAKAKPATLDIPSQGSYFVNGEPAKAGSMELPAGELVISSYKDGQYHHEVTSLKAGASFAPNPTWSTMQGSKSWDSFQGGPQRTGYSMTSDRNELKLQWSKDFGDKVQSSPIILGSAAYFSSDDHLLSAVDLNNGEVLWSDDQMGSDISPIANQAYVFSGNSVGEFGGYRLKDGKRKGSTHVGSSPSSLSLISDLAFLASTRDNQIFSIKTKKGFTGRLPLKVNWSIDLPELGNSTASPVIIGNKAVYQTDKGNLIAISIEDGKRLWPKQGAGAAASAEPQEQMTLAFTDAADFLTPTPAAQGSTIFAVADKKLMAVNANDGSQLWSKNLSYKPSSSLSCANGLIYMGSGDGKVYAHSTVNGAVAFSVSISDKPVFASPVLFKDKLLVAGGDGVIKLLHSFTGKTLAENKELTGSPIQSTPAVSDSHIFVINKKGKMACFK